MKTFLPLIHSSPAPGQTWAKYKNAKVGYLSGLFVTGVHQVVIGP